MPYHTFRDLKICGVYHNNWSVGGRVCLTVQDDIAQDHISNAFAFKKIWKCIAIQYSMTMHFDIQFIKLNLTHKNAYERAFLRAKDMIQYFVCQMGLSVCSNICAWPIRAANHFAELPHEARPLQQQHLAHWRSSPRTHHSNTAEQRSTHCPVHST